MAVVKNKTTPRGREFWSHVESIASQAPNSERVSMRRSAEDLLQSAGDGPNKDALSCAGESDNEESSPGR